ncbi:hypothetical protein MIMGU_mgv11b0208991mg, partial [Erythranthe guttata]
DPISEYSLIQTRNRKNEAFRIRKIDINCYVQGGGQVYLK